MIKDKRDLILRGLSEGTGAAFAASEVHSGLRHGLRIWFDDFDEKHGPVAELRPFGLKGYRITLYFGNFSGEVIDQIRHAAQEDIQLARALIASVRGGIALEIPGQHIDDWRVVDGSFRITATIRDQADQHEDTSLILICREVIVPMMAAMAELIGYDVIDEQITEDIPAYEGAVLQSVVKRRERNPRNRLLCIRIHGERCKVCGLEPKTKYGAAGSIIEVHHREPLAALVEARPYDPSKDLVPLCPSCHRAVHTRRPIPYSPEDLVKLMEDRNG